MSDEEEDPLHSTPPVIDRNRPEDIVKIMLATDNHIGFNERDPVRGQDSINSFKEILQLAVKHEVDFILLGGDLFHDNRPSRDTIYQVVALAREYCLGDKPIEIELLSDPNEGQATGYSFPAINYEDPNLNISIPIFSIHGNHDDPQGHGPEGALCALDLMSVTGLVNYIGKSDLPSDDKEAATTGLAVRPVLLQKGRTRLGLYGIGNIKDQRLHFELRSNRVRMFMPSDKDDWFNILLVHQNRVKRGTLEAVPEGMFDDSVRLVVWGHEHDCRIVPEPVATKEYMITQPGSSVATSLADGESIEKHVALLEIQDLNYELHPIPLRTVRPFVLDEIVLSEYDTDELDVSDPLEIKKFLKSKVEEMIGKTYKQWDSRNRKVVAETGKELPEMLPLIRLKVDTTGIPEMTNPVRLGHEFDGRVANPRDVVIFHRAKRSTANKTKADEPELEDDEEADPAEAAKRVRVGELVREFLAAQELQLLGEAGMGDAVRAFVEKADSKAIEIFLTQSLRQLSKSVQPQGDADLNDDDFDEAITQARVKHEKEYEQNAGSLSKDIKGKKKADDDDDAASVDSMAMDVDYGAGDGMSDEESEPPPPKKKRAPAKSTATKAATPSEDSDAIEESEPGIKPEPPKKVGRAAALGSTKAAPARKTAAKSQAKGASSGKQSTLSGFAGSSRSALRAAASKATRKTKAMISSDDE